MDILADLWSRQPVFLVTVAMFIFAMSLSRLGTRLLAKWLGLTDTNARRISRAIVVGIWLVIFLLVSSLRIGR